MRVASTLAALAAAVLVAAPAQAQRQLEMGLDLGATFGLGDRSSVNINFPGSRFRVGFFRPGSQVSIEPALGFGYNKVEGTDGQFNYDLELGALYHFRPIEVTTTESDTTVTRVAPPYLRPFVGVIGFTGGDASDNEFTAGVGLGTKFPWRQDLSIRAEVNVGYGFDNKAARIGLLTGFSFFPR